MGSDIIASRTPEGFPTRCPLCGSETNIEFSSGTRDALCPNCGTLLWQSSDLLNRLYELIGEPLGVSRQNFTADTPIASTTATHDSLDTVEIFMRLEEQFDLNVSDDEAERIQTVGDLIRFLQGRLRDNDSSQDRHN